MNTCEICGKPGGPYCSPQHEALAQPEQETALEDPPARHA